jgi:hypothetical protein
MNTVRAFTKLFGCNESLSKKCQSFIKPATNDGTFVQISASKLLDSSKYTVNQPEEHRIAFFTNDIKLSQSWLADNLDVQLEIEHEVVTIVTESEAIAVDKLEKLCEFLRIKGFVVGE